MQSAIKVVHPNGAIYDNHASSILITPNLLPNADSPEVP